MASFKLAKKDALSYTRTNIYDLYEKKLEYFVVEKSKLNEYRSSLKKLKKEINFENRHINFKKIEELESRIENITNDNELNDYLLNFIEIIKKEDTEYSEIQQKGQLDSFVNSKINNSKTEVYNDYIRKFNPELKEIDITSQKKVICDRCGSESFSYELKTSSTICMDCGSSQNVIFNEESGPVYSDNLEQVTVFNYQRNNHFLECLNQFQAKENTTIPKNIINELTFEFRKYNIKNPKLFTKELVKSYLKKLGYNKYYEHVPTIINELCGLPAPKMDSALEKQLKIMFDEVQIPFEKYRKNICPDRVNFLNYNYTFHKMLQLLGRDEFLDYFDLLKSRDKLYEHDLIWKGICTDLKWEFIASI